MSQQFPPDPNQPWNPPSQPVYPQSPWNPPQQPGYSQPLYGPPSQPGYPGPQGQQPFYNQQNPPYQQPPVFPPQQPGSSLLPVQRRKNPKEIWQNAGKGGKCSIIAVGLIVVLSMCICSGVVNASRDNTTPAAPKTAATTPMASQMVLSKATPKPTPKPTSTPKPTATVSPAQLEALYKSITTTTTVDTLDKDAAVDKGHEVHFTGRLLKFVKDDSGNTAGANVDDPNTDSSSVVQIIFPKGTDVTQLNEGDMIEVWGTDAGVFSGTNAFGGDVQEVGIAANYLTDQTTAYSAGS